MQQQKLQQCTEETCLPHHAMTLMLEQVILVRRAVGALAMREASFKKKLSKPQPVLARYLHTLLSSTISGTISHLTSPLLSPAPSRAGRALRFIRCKVAC